MNNKLYAARLAHLVFWLLTGGVLGMLPVLWSTAPTGPFLIGAAFIGLFVLIGTGPLLLETWWSMEAWAR